MRKGVTEYSFATQRPFFSTGSTSGHLCIQFYLIQGYDNLCVGRLGREYRLVARWKFLDRMRSLEDLLSSKAEK